MVSTFCFDRSLTELEQRTSRLTNEFQQTIENLSMKIEEQKHITQVNIFIRNDPVLIDLFRIVTTFVDNLIHYKNNYLTGIFFLSIVN